MSSAAPGRGWSAMSSVRLNGVFAVLRGLILTANLLVGQSLDPNCFLCLTGIGALPSGRFGTQIAAPRVSRNSLDDVGSISLATLQAKTSPWRPVPSVSQSQMPQEELSGTSSAGWDAAVALPVDRQEPQSVEWLRASLASPEDSLKVPLAGMAGAGLGRTHPRAPHDTGDPQLSASAPRGPPHLPPCSVLSPLSPAVPEGWQQGQVCSSGHHA